MARAGTGVLVIIGGHEDKEDEAPILREVVRRVGSGKLVVATVAPSTGRAVREYERVFRRLGVKHVYNLDVNRATTQTLSASADLSDGADVFFTGGDQLRSPPCSVARRCGADPRASIAVGGIVAGTSAGASVMSDTMLVAAGRSLTGSALAAHGARASDSCDVIIDQHFAERGRIGRLLGAVAQNPRLLGIGIDENTAVVVDGTAEAAASRTRGRGRLSFNGWTRRLHQPQRRGGRTARCRCSGCGWTCSARATYDLARAPRRTPPRTWRRKRTTPHRIFLGAYVRRCTRHRC